MYEVSLLRPADGGGVSGPVLGVEANSPEDALALAQLAAAMNGHAYPYAVVRLNGAEILNTIPSV